MLMLFPGPVHDVASYIGHRLEGLSTFAHGTVIVNGKPDVARFGHFDVIALAPRGGGIRTLLDVISHATTVQTRAREQGDPLRLVVTYDPLRSGLAGAWIARAGGIPLVIQLNGDYSNPANYRDIRNPLARFLKRHIYVGIEHLTLRRARGVKILYPEQLVPFRRDIRHAQVLQLASYVELDKFVNLGEEPEILFVGFPFRLKGVDILIDAFKMVTSSFPEWRLKIVGWYPDETELRRAIGTTPRIEIHRPVPYREMPAHIGRCGILVLPSRTEAMGRVLLEAMAAGKPRVGARVGGIPTVINDGQDGFLFEPGDSEDLARVLRLLMSNAALRQRMGKTAAERAQREFSPAAYIAGIRDFYCLAADHQGTFATPGL